MFKYFVKSSKSFTNLGSYSIFFKNQLKTMSTTTQNKMTPQEYEREWTKLYEAKMKEKMDNINKELSVSEKTEVEFIFDHIKTLSKDELKYLAILLKIKETKLTGVSPLESNSLHPSKMTQKVNLWPKENPNWFNTSNLQATLNSFQGKKGQVGIKILKILKFPLQQEENHQRQQKERKNQNPKMKNHKKRQLMTSN